MGDEIWVRTRLSVIRRLSGTEGREASDAAWRYFFENYRSPIERSLGRHLRGKGDASEACDEFFAYLLESGSLPRYDSSTGRFRAFLQGVLRNYALSWRRQRRDLRERDVESLPEPSFEEESRWVEEEEAEWAGAVLRAALHRLLGENRPRADMLMRAYGIAPYPEMSRPELAKELGKQVGALNVALLEARRQLGRYIVDELVQQVGSRQDFERERDAILARLLAQSPTLFDGLALDVEAS